jgi:hypothetical protein
MLSPSTQVAPAQTEQNTVDEGNQNREKQGGPKSIHFKTINPSRG